MMEVELSDRPLTTYVVGHAQRWPDQRHPAVADAAVIASPDERSGEVPKAFVVLASPASAEELLRFVADRVAPYRKVRIVEFIDEIPKSPSGKSLRRVLVERDRAVIASAG